MKKLSVLFFLLFSISCFAEDLPSVLEDSKTIERDSFDKNKLNIYDGNNRKTGYIEPYTFDKDKLIIYDKNNKKIGTIERDSWDKNKWNIKRK